MSQPNGASEILKGLASECERAPHSNFQLECEIAQAVGAYSTPPRNYTVSIDSAMDLIPHEVVDWRLQTARHRKGYAASLFTPTVTFNGDGVTPALAICAAAIRARASTIDSESMA